MTPHPFDNQPEGGATRTRLRPRDAATILLFDRSGSGNLRVLMGKRGKQHAFMPEYFVFPGGRRDRGDSLQPVSGELQPAVTARLSIPSDAGSERRARGLAVAALRELWEETGLAVGTLQDRHDGATLVPDLSTLRYIARAITPPGNVRRFDTRFFSTFADEADVDPGAICDSSELTELQWLDIQSLSDLKMPPITRAILEDAKNLIEVDPSLPFGSAGPFYYARRGRMLRDSI